MLSRQWKYQSEPRQFQRPLLLRPTRASLCKHLLARRIKTAKPDCQATSSISTFSAFRASTISPPAMPSSRDLQPQLSKSISGRHHNNPRWLIGGKACLDVRRLEELLCLDLPRMVRRPSPEQFLGLADRYDASCSDDRTVCCQAGCRCMSTSSINTIPWVCVAA